MLLLLLLLNIRIRIRTFCLYNNLCLCQKKEKENKLSQHWTKFCLLLNSFSFVWREVKWEHQKENEKEQKFSTINIGHRWRFLVFAGGSHNKKKEKKIIIRNRKKNLIKWATYINRVKIKLIERRRKKKLIMVMTNNERNDKKR